MKTDVETLDPTRVRLTVEVPFDELKGSLDAAYRELGRQVRIPGFRPGKVPARIIDARIGRGAVLEQAINEALPRLYAEAVEEAGALVIGQPEIDITNIDDGTLLTFTADVDVKPDFELPAHAGIEVTVDAIAVTDESVEEQIEALRERFATSIEVERAAADGDVVAIDLIAHRDGEVVAGGEATGQTYKVGTGDMVDGLDEAVRGLSAGESATFSAALIGVPEDGESEITVTVNAVKEQQLPPLDDDFAQLASEFDTVDEMREDTRGRLRRVALRQQIIEARDKVLQAYLEQVDVPLPERLVAHEVEHRVEAMVDEMRMYGLTMEQYLTSRSIDQDEFNAETEKRARDAIKSQFVLESLATKEQLSVDENELTSYIVGRASQSGVSPDQYVQQVLQGGGVSSVVGEVARGKALESLVTSAMVHDTNGDAIDLAASEAELSGGFAAAPSDESDGDGDDSADRASAGADENATDGDTATEDES